MKKLVLVENFPKSLDHNVPFSNLSPERKIRANMLFNEQEKERFVIAEEITSQIISRCFNIENAEICGKVSEKPYIKNHENISFSRSYCNDTLCIAVENGGRIGVDCETVKKADDGVMRYFFTANEKNYIADSDDKDFAFSLIWTRKESYIKCLGKGLDFRFDLLDVTPKQPLEAGQRLFFKNDKVENLHINSYLLDHTVISVCSEIDDNFPELILGW